MQNTNGKEKEVEKLAEEAYPIKSFDEYKSQNDFDYWRHRIYDKREGFVSGHKAAQSQPSTVLGWLDVELWAFYYCPCTEESADALMSLHKSKETAETALEQHKEEKRKMYEKVFAGDADYTEDCPFGFMESWFVYKIKIQE